MIHNRAPTTEIISSVEVGIYLAVVLVYALGLLKIQFYKHPYRPNGLDTQPPLENLLYILFLGGDILYLIMGVNCPRDTFVSIHDVFLLHSSLPAPKTQTRRFTFASSFVTRYGRS